MPSVQSLVVNYLDAARIMHLATQSERGAWSSTVYFAVDNIHNLYWLSEPNARHSRDIAETGRVAGSIALPQQYGQPQQGLQVEGEVRLVDTQETARFFQAYAERFTAHGRLEEILNGNDPVRLYQLVPSRFVLYDEGFFPNQPHQEWRTDGSAVTVDEELPEQAALLGEEDIPAENDSPEEPPTPQGPQVPPIIPPRNPGLF